MQRAEREPDFLARQTCVSWLHFVGNY